MFIWEGFDEASTVSVNGTEIGTDADSEDELEKNAPHAAAVIRAYRESKRKTAIRIAAEIIKDGSKTIPQIARNAGISKRTAARYMKELQEAGVLKRNGSDNAGTWILA